MKYYNSRGEIENIDFGLPKIEAPNSNIYELKNGIYFKKYLDSTELNIRIVYEIFGILKKIDSPFTNNILELYYDLDVDRDELLKKANNCATTGYKYIFLEEEPRDLLRESTEYFLYNVRELEELLIKAFGDYKVMANDLKRENSVYHDGKIVLIDLDSCYVEKYTKSEIILKQNLKELYYLVFDLFNKCNSFSIQYLGVIEQLLWLEEDDKSLYEVLSRRLAKYKTPMDYINDN